MSHSEVVLLISPRQLGLRLPACLQVGGPSTSTTDHGALPYRAAHKAVNPSRAGPHADLDLGMVSIQVPQYMLAPFGPDQPIRSRPFMTILPFLPRCPQIRSQVSHLAGKKTLARFSYTGLAAFSPRPIPPHTTPTTSLLSLFLPQSQLLLLLFPGRYAQASPSSSSRVLDAAADPTNHRHRGPLGNKNFSATLTTAVAPTQQHVGQTHPVWPLLKASRASHGAAGCASPLPSEQD